jgi:hypothetical protein
MLLGPSGLDEHGAALADAAGLVNAAAHCAGTRHGERAETETRAPIMQVFRVHVCYLPIHRQCSCWQVQC